MVNFDNLTLDGINSLKDVFYRSVTIDQLKITFQGIRCDEIISSAIPSHAHNFFEFHYLLSGKVKTTVNGMERVYGPGQCYLMTPTSVHKHECMLPPDDCYHGITIRWTMQTVHKDIFNPELDSVRIALEKSRAEIIEDHQQSLARELNEIITRAQNDAARIELSLRLAGLIIQIGRRYAAIRNEKKKPLAIPKAAEAILQQAISFIENHSTEMISPSDVTASLSISYSHLARLFSQYLHTSITHYIMRVKIDRAIHLLLCTDMCIQDIAEALGFSSLSYFSHTFKTMVGFSPRSYLKYVKEHANKSDFSLL